MPLHEPQLQDTCRFVQRVHPKLQAECCLCSVSLNPGGLPLRTVCALDVTCGMLLGTVCARYQRWWNAAWHSVCPGVGGMPHTVCAQEVTDRLPQLYRTVPSGLVQCVPAKVQCTCAQCAVESEGGMLLCTVWCMFCSVTFLLADAISVCLVSADQHVCGGRCAAVVSCSPPDSVLYVL
jgi:hypothetical protein